MEDQKMPAAHALLSRQRLIGIALMALAFFFFSMLDTAAKWLNHSIPTSQTVWSRYVFSVMFVLMFINPKSKPGVLKTKRPMLQLVRSFLLFASTMFNFIALNYLQLSQTTAIAFAAPLIVTFLSGPLLGEHISRDRMIAIGVGFCGVLLVARPGFGGIHPVAFLSIIGVTCYALFAIMTRHLAAHDSTETTLVYSGLVGAGLLSLVMPFIWKNPPDLLVLGLMVAMGAFAAIGHYMLISAHRYAPANVLSPFGYTQLIWMVILGYVVFGDVPDVFTLGGGVIVVGSGLYLLSRERSRQPIPLEPAA